MALSLTKVRMQSSLVAILCLGTGTLAGYLLLSDLSAAAQRAESARAAIEAARRTESVLQSQLQSLSTHAAQRETIQALTSATKDSRARRAEEIQAALPEALAVSIVARADMGTAAGALLERSCLEALKQAAASGTAIGFHERSTFAGRHYDVVQPVRDEQQRMLGYLLASFPTTLITQRLDDGADSSYVELRQAHSNAYPTVIATGDRAHAKSEAVVTNMGLSGLQLVYWARPRLAWYAEQMYYVVVLIVATLGLLATGYTFHRATARAIQNDLKSLALMSQDVRSGQLRADYPVELRDFADVFQVLRDFGKRIAEEKEKLKELGLIDHLSQLSNRRHFELRLNDLYELSRTRPRSSVLMIDIDGFKAVNDRLGHEAGDALIVGIADALSRLVRHTDVLARLGGDEFCIIYACTSLDQAIGLARRLREQLPPRILLGRGVAHPLRWSGGLSVMQQSDARGNDVLWRADQALIHAKRAGGNLTLPYNPTFGPQPAPTVATS
jgi:diguanylate cyclase (GGDEF)-like protein